jgi:RimJ/RimL family protein N-acetyltransferase
MENKYYDGLETNRFLTRKLVREDESVWLEFLKNKETSEYLPAPDSMSTEEFAKHWIDWQLLRYADCRFGLQAIIQKETRAFIGQCGLLTQTVDGQEELEVGYHVLRQYWGQGYAPEAARLFIDFAFEQNLTDSVISMIDVKNVKSQRVAEKNGLAREKQTLWRGMNIYVYRISK